MQNIRSINHIILDKLTAPHPAINDPKKQLVAKTVSFMSLVMILGVVINLIFGSGLTLFSLFILILGYGFSRTRRYSVATYLIITILLFVIVRSLLTMGLFNSHTIFTHIAWLTLSLVFASLLLSIQETILIAAAQLVILYILAVIVPEIHLSEALLSFGYLCVFSTLLIITKWQRNRIEEARKAQIHQQATHDQLTGLPNRRFFYDRLVQTLARLKTTQTISAILYLDLDDFKNVNDEFGHDVGDLVLKVIAERIRSCIRDMDTGARLSGDEFAILLEGVSGSSSAGEIARNILNSISSPIQIPNCEVMVSGSIGITMIPKDGNDDTGLLINADTAMYHAKHKGKNTISFFTSVMKEKMLQNINLGKNLHQALERKEFFIEYQPQYNAQTGKIFGAEALLRWQHPIKGKIPPMEFIPIAERNGMIIPIGKSVLTDVVCFHQDIETALEKNVRVSVNLSPRQLADENFIVFLSDMIEATRVDPSYLELEITENCVFENFDRILSILKQLRSLGLRLAIDDFGTGYSSLSYLEKIPVNTVKIDKSFVRKIKNLDDHLPILTGIINIATDMGLDVIAEGVEKEIQLNFLLGHGCHLIQGQYFNSSFSEQVLMRILNEQDGYPLVNSIPSDFPARQSASQYWLRN